MVGVQGRGCGVEMTRVSTHMQVKLPREEQPCPAAQEDQQHRLQHHLLAHSCSRDSP